jgi:alpha-N-arabinofuranosidase
MLEHIEMEGHDMKAVNSAAGEVVKPVSNAGSTVDGGMVKVMLKKASWNVIRFSVS